MCFCKIEEYAEVVVAIGNPTVREKLVCEPGAVVQTVAQLGKACIVNAGAVVNHNSTVEDYCQVDCNAVVAARALVPKGTKVMSGTVWMG